MMNYYLCRFDGAFSNETPENLTCVEILMKQDFSLHLSLLNNELESSKELIVRFGKILLKSIGKDKTVVEQYPSESISPN
jgi:hypothetical protein